MKTSFYSEEELRTLGLAQYGKNVQISRFCSIYSAEKISLGDHVRVDDFCILSGRITLGSFVHISAYSCIFAGTEGVTIEDFSCLSSRVAVYALNDDYSGASLTNSTIPSEYRKVCASPVHLLRHVVVGTGTTILPGVTVGTGVSIGAMSLVRTDLPEWGVYVGIPAHRIKDRSRELLQAEKRLLADGRYVRRSRENGLEM